MLQKIKQASYKLASLSAAKRNSILREIAAQIGRSQKQILRANVRDIKNFVGDPSVGERLKLDRKKIKQIIESIHQVVKLADPLSRQIEIKNRANGLVMKKISVPLGVVGVIYESRPNVTVDLAVLAIKSGNAAVLKGGKESSASNKILVSLIHRALKKHGLPSDLVCLIDPRTEWKKVLFTARGLVDVIIPRGGQGLIEFVRNNSRIPVIETGAGVCHTFVDDYDVKKSAAIIVNAKIQAPAVCNALDTLVINQPMIKTLLPALAAPLAEHGVEILADAKSYLVLKNIYPADLLHQVGAGRDRSLQKAYGVEFLSLKMSIKTVENFAEGLSFVKKHTSGHSEAILTNNKKHASTFLKEVDAATVYHNASTRFTDGAQFGLGAEVGISTQKFHARGPMGLEALTSYKWVVEGRGQIRA